jgi:hypothetical protein
MKDISTTNDAKPTEEKKGPEPVDPFFGKQYIC